MNLLNSESLTLFVRFSVAVLTTILFVLATQELSLEAINKNNEYGDIYQKLTEDDILTEEEMATLDQAYEEHLADDSARSERLNSYFGVIFIGMLAFSVVTFIFSYTRFFGSPILIASVVLVTAIITSGGLWSALFWTIFYFVGVLPYFMRNKKRA